MQGIGGLIPLDWSVMAIPGSCLCGEVCFELDAAPGPFEFCHCNRCRKLSGGSSLPMIRVRTADYRSISGANSISAYEAPLLYRPPAYTSYFCGTCGSPVPPAEPEGHWVEVPAGLLDADPGLKPDKHIFIEFVPEWDCISDRLPQFTVQALHRHRYGKDLPEGFRVRPHQTKNAVASPGDNNE